VTLARRLYRHGRASFYAVTALRLWGQAEQQRGNDRRAADLLARAATLAPSRGGRLDRLALCALAGERLDDREPLRAAVSWATGGCAP
jgi:hypothetical protein